MRTRFSRWSGRQDPLGADLSADDVIEQLADDLLGGYDAQSALDRLLRRGVRGRVNGLAELRRRVERARRRELERMGLEGPLREVEQRLEEIVERERVAVQFDAHPDAGEKQEFLDNLPADLARRLSALQDYAWTDRQAGAEFRALLEQLRQDVAQATFGQLAAALQSTSPEDVQRMRELLAELNELIAMRERGEDTTQAFADFKRRHGAVLPPAETLEELLEELARRMAAMSALLAGLDPQQREQLADMAGQLLGDLDLSFQAAALSAALQRMFPQMGWNEPVAGAMPSGTEQGSLSSTVDWMERLREFEDVGHALAQDYPGARLEDVDEDALRRALGDDAVADLRALREIERVLEEAGAAARVQGRLELTPRGIRRLGERSLARIYERAVSGQVGSHETAARGGDGELTGSTRAWHFGDPFRLDVGRSIANAVVRGGRRAQGVQLSADDFELAEAERRVRAVTVLLLDMSFSMPLRGNWVPAKRVALALQALIASKFPEDRFFVVGFSDYARRLQPRDLLATGWERVYGTNMQHAFLLTRRLLGAYPATERQVIMVTDGEPTAHLEDGQALFNWPPEPRTLQLTLQEAARLARTGATLNVFLLDHDPGAARFVEQMVSAYGGRIFYPDLDDLGSLVVRDYLRGRRS